MKVDVSEELATLRGYLAAPGSPVADGVVAGFLWALSLVSGETPDVLRARVGPATSDPGDVLPLTSPGAAPPVTVLPATVPAAAVPPSDAVVARPWAGLGMARIPRARVVDPDDPAPPAAARAFTAGPDGRPVALEASFAEQACGLLVDSDSPDGPAL